MTPSTAQKKNIAIGIALTLLMITFVASGFFGLAWEQWSANYLWLSRTAYWVILAIVYRFATTKEQSELLIWKGRNRTVLFYAGSTICVLAGLAVIEIGCSILVTQIGIKSDQHVLQDMFVVLCHSLPLLVYTCLTAAFVEEFIFRGYLLPRIELLSGNRWIAIVLSSLLFGLAHLRYWSLVNLIVPFFIGILFAVYYSKYKQLGVLILCHFIIDFYLLSTQCK